MYTRSTVSSPQANYGSNHVLNPIPMAMPITPRTPDLIPPANDTPGTFINPP